MQLDIEQIFSHHPPKDEDTMVAHANVRSLIRAVAHELNDHLQDSPEKTLAIRKLQEAMMFANSAIAQYGVRDRSNGS